MSKVLEIKQLRKVYGEDIIALEAIDLEVKKGDFIALLGPNGAGKSTTIGIVSSLVNKTSGKVKINNYDIDVLTRCALSFLLV
jgi:ABC-2 type transport system ATP-binding protein